MDITSLVSQSVKNLKPISWGDTSYEESYLVLKWGENPYDPPPDVQNAIAKCSKVNVYPSQMGKLKEKIANYCQVDVGQVCMTNGADKAFRLLAEICMDESNEVITFTPSYPVFDTAIQATGGKLKRLALDKNFLIPSVSKIKKAVTLQTKLIYVCNPNNPTGNFIATSDQLEELLALDVLVVVDEAYFEFSQKTALSLLAKYDNLIIIRSLSKTFGLAGLRVAYMLGSPKIIKYFQTFEESVEVFSIATPSLSGAIAAFDALAEIKKNIKLINKTKDTLTAGLAKLGIKVYPSDTSFILFNLKSQTITAAEFLTKMAKRKIILKDVSIYEGLSPYDCYIGIPKENDIKRVISTVKSVVRNY